MTDAKILVIDDNTAVLSTLEHIDSGYVPAFEAWVAHLNQVDAWTVGVRSSFVAGLWRVDGTWIVEFTSLNLKGSEKNNTAGVSCCVG